VCDQPQLFFDARLSQHDLLRALTRLGWKLTGKVAGRSTAICPECAKDDIAQKGGE
jgi:hypothetical protein